MVIEYWALVEPKGRIYSTHANISAAKRALLAKILLTIDNNSFCLAKNIERWGIVKLTGEFPDEADFDMHGSHATDVVIGPTSTS